MIKRWLKGLLRGEIMMDYWDLIDEILSKKKHNRMLQFVNGRYYEIIRRMPERNKKQW